MAVVTITIRLRWWVRPYLAALYLFSLAVRMQPDEGKVGAMVRRGMVIETRLTRGLEA